MNAVSGFHFYWMPTWPATCAVTWVSIFIASSTSNTSPACRLLPRLRGDAGDDTGDWAAAHLTRRAALRSRRAAAGATASRGRGPRKIPLPACVPDAPGASDSAHLDFHFVVLIVDRDI